MSDRGVADHTIEWSKSRRSRPRSKESAKTGGTVFRQGAVGAGKGHRGAGRLGMVLFRAEGRGRTYVVPDQIATASIHLNLQSISNVRR
jgi:hypothetical protein